MKIMEYRKRNGIEKTEMWIDEDNHYMTCLVEELIHYSLIKGNTTFENEIMSIVKRHDLLEQNFIRKKDTLEYIKSITSYTYIPNPFFENDKLGKANFSYLISNSSYSGEYWLRETRLPSKYQRPWLYS